MYFLTPHITLVLFWWLSGKGTTGNTGDTGHVGSIPELGRSPGGEMATHSNVLAGEIP